jgi:hypothetical protein
MPQDGDTQFEHYRRCLEVLDRINRIRSTRQNDPLRIEVADELWRDVVGMQLAIHLLFADAAGDQLRDLRAEVENENFPVGHGPGLKCSGRPAAARWSSIDAQSTW